MLQTRFRVQLAARLQPLIAALPSISLSASLLTTPSPVDSRSKRHASHASQGRANKAAPGPGKRLGAKRGDSELVVPGNIIFRQRGSLWFPGENCVMGRDHTISALEKGYVRYYKDIDRHPTRKYIGVVFNQDDRLPRPKNTCRQRRLGLEEVPIGSSLMAGAGQLLEEDLLEKPGPKLLGRIEKCIKKASRAKIRRHLTLGDGYQYRETNASIGRTADRKNIVLKKLTYKQRVRRRGRQKA